MSGSSGEVRRGLPGLSVQQRPLLELLQARLIGTLEVDASTNCLGVRSGDTVVDVAWPQGWSVQIRDDAVALVDEGGWTVGRLGDEVSVGGGFVDATRAGIVSCAGRQWVFEATGVNKPDAG